MQTDTYRKNILILIITAIISTTIEVILFWNTFLRQKDSPGILPFIFFLLSTLLLGYAINIILKSLSPKTINDYINKKVTEARIQVLKEFEKKEEVVEDSDEKEQVEEKLKNIIPKGNFKTTDAYLEKLMKNMANQLEFVQGIVYMRVNKTKKFKYSSGFALTNSDEIQEFKEGENLTGQAVANKDLLIIDDIPEEYFDVESGLGNAKPKQILIVPVLVKSNVYAVLELASFKDQDNISKETLRRLMTETGSKIEQITKA